MWKYIDMEIKVVRVKHLEHLWVLAPSLFHTPYLVCHQSWCWFRKLVPRIELRAILAAKKIPVGWYWSVVTTAVQHYKHLPVQRLKGLHILDYNLCSTIRMKLCFSKPAGSVFILLASESTTGCCDCGCVVLWEHHRLSTCHLHCVLENDLGAPKRTWVQRARLNA